MTYSDLEVHHQSKILKLVICCQRWHLSHMFWHLSIAVAQGGGKKNHTAIRCPGTSQHWEHQQQAPHLLHPPASLTGTHVPQVGLKFCIAADSLSCPGIAGKCHHASFMQRWILNPGICACQTVTLLTGLRLKPPEFCYRHIKHPQDLGNCIPTQRKIILFFLQEAVICKPCEF